MRVRADTDKFNVLKKLVLERLSSFCRFFLRERLAFCPWPIDPSRRNSRLFSDSVLIPQNLLNLCHVAVDNGYGGGSRS